MTPDTPFFIVLNAGSGKRDTETIEATIRGVLEQAGRRYDLARIDHPRQLPRLVERAVKLAQQQGAVVVAGGDGTINLVLALEHEGQTEILRTPTLVVGNNALQLEQIGIPHADAVQQGLLVAITVRPIGTRALLGLLCRGALGQLGDADHVVSFAFDRLTVRPYRRRRIKVAMDGEVTWLRTPLVFQVASHPLPLLVPACAMTTSPAEADEAVL